MWSIDKDGLIPGNKEYAPGKIRLVTHSDNVRERNKREGHPMIVNPYCIAKALIGVNTKNYTLIFYKSCKDAFKDGFKDAGSCAKGNRKTCGGYVWFYNFNLLDVLNFLYVKKV